MCARLVRAVWRAGRGYMRVMTGMRKWGLRRFPLRTAGPVSGPVGPGRGGRHGGHVFITSTSARTTLQVQVQHLNACTHARIATAPRLKAVEDTFACSTRPRRRCRPHSASCQAPPSHPPCFARPRTRLSPLAPTHCLIWTVLKKEAAFIKFAYGNLQCGRQLGSTSAASRLK